jgi:hypothetical protein
VKHKQIHSCKINFSQENVTSFAGIVLTERLAMRLGLWGVLEKRLGRRRGSHYSWVDVFKPMTVGLLTGSQGISAAESIKEDVSLKKLLSLKKIADQSQIWRIMEEVGHLEGRGEMRKVQTEWAKRIIRRVPINKIKRFGFVPVFGDGTLLEGSARREGSKYIKGKGHGMLWNTCFIGPVLAMSHLSGKGEGENRYLRSALPELSSEILKPLKLHRDALILMDSLHGDEPTLQDIEACSLKYIVGANKLSESKKILALMPESSWYKTEADQKQGIAESAVCSCWIQCPGWKEKRLLIGRRFRRDSELFREYSAVITNLDPEDVKHLLKKNCPYPQVVWKLYSMKSAMENHYKDALNDLGLHHPPSEKYLRNAGFYAMASLALLLGTAVELIGSKGRSSLSLIRKDATKRRRPTPSKMRLWRLRRTLFALPGRIAQHAKTLTVTLLGISPMIQRLFQKYFLNIIRC